MDPLKSIRLDGNKLPPVNLSLLTLKKTGKAGVVELSFCIREETSSGGRLKGSLFRAVLLKPFGSNPD